MMDKQSVPQEPWLDQLQNRLGVSWINIVSARQNARGKRQELAGLLEDVETEDSSVIVFGSLARDEFTSGSDVDWTLLIDGSADPKHLKVAQQIQKRLEKSGYKSPAQEGAFGGLAFSHELIHLIGGQDDTNRNTTQRILLLLESAALGNSQVPSRVVRCILNRYVEDLRLWSGSGQHWVPRFLLNDIVRYWRTVAVDFAYKMRTREEKGWALRTVKLRMSRKLLFASGLLLCFNCALLIPAKEQDRIFGSGDVSALVDRLAGWTEQTPLELLAGAFLQEAGLEAEARRLFQAYDEFLGLLNDDSTRSHLEALARQELDADGLFQKARRLGHDFQDGLNALFFREGAMGQLTKRYGVF
jgi:predicted nucleotidyltransferase